MLNSVGIIYNGRIPEAKGLAQQVADTVRRRGCTIWLGGALDLDRPDTILPHFDLVVTLGGDGTILRATRLAAPQGAPVVGVNLGQLGFLAELSPLDVPQQLSRILDGEGWMEERMMLRTSVQAAGLAVDALNDSVVSRGPLPRAVRIDVHIDGALFTTYVADGVIVATPTGSTAYSLALGGPIIEPSVHSILITPVAGHLTVVRSLVVPPVAKIGLTFHSREPGTVSIDGQIDIPVQEGDTIEVSASPFVARFVRLQPRGYFYRSLVQRLSTTSARGMP